MRFERIESLIVKINTFNLHCDKFIPKTVDITSYSVNFSDCCSVSSSSEINFSNCSDTDSELFSSSMERKASLPCNSLLRSTARSRDNSLAKKINCWSHCI